MISGSKPPASRSALGGSGTALTVNPPRSIRMLAVVGQQNLAEE